MQNVGSTRLTGLDVATLRCLASKRGVVTYSSHSCLWWSPRVVWAEIFECVCLGPILFLYFGPIEARRLGLTRKWPTHVATELDKFNPRVRVYSVVHHHPASTTDSGLPVVEAKRNVEIVYGVVQRVVSEVAVDAEIRCSSMAQSESTRKRLEMALEARRLSGGDHSTLVEETKRRSRELLTPETMLWTRVWTVDLERVAHWFEINVLTQALPPAIVWQCVAHGLRRAADGDATAPSHNGDDLPTTCILNIGYGAPDARGRRAACQLLERYYELSRREGVCQWLNEDLEQVPCSNQYRLRTANPNQVAQLSAHRVSNGGVHAFESEESVLEGCAWRSTLATRSNGKLHVYMPTIVDAAVFDREVGVRHFVERAHVSRMAHAPCGSRLPTTFDQKIQAAMHDSKQLGWANPSFCAFFKTYNVLIEALCVAHTLGTLLDAAHSFQDEYEGIDAFVRAGAILRDGQSMEQVIDTRGINMDRPWCWLDAFAHNVGVIAAPEMRPPVHFKGMEPPAPPAGLANVSVHASHEFFGTDADREWIERTPYRPCIGLGQSAILQLVRMHKNETTGEYEPGEVLVVPDQRIGASSIREECEEAYPDNEDVFPVAEWPLGGLRLEGKHRGNRTTNLPTGEETILTESPMMSTEQLVDAPSLHRCAFGQKLVLTFAPGERLACTKPWFPTNRDPLFVHCDKQCDLNVGDSLPCAFMMSCSRVRVWHREDVGVRKLAVRTRFSLPSIPRSARSKEPTVLAIRITVATPPHLMEEPFPMYTSTLTAPFELRVKAPKRRLDESVV